MSRVERVRDLPVVVLDPFTHALPVRLLLVRVGGLHAAAGLASDLKLQISGAAGKAQACTHSTTSST